MWPGAGSDTVTDAVGPERPTFVELVRLIRQTVGSRGRIIHLPHAVMPVLSSALGPRYDVLLTREEYRAMATGLADTEGVATGDIAVSQWLAEHADSLGRHYANEIDRHFR